MYFFRHAYGCLAFYNELIQEAHKYGNRRQKEKVFPKVVVTKIVIKNSYVLETFQNDNQDKVKRFFAQICGVPTIPLLLPLPY